MNNVKGIVFDIHRAAVHDGPGLRTAVFLKGCPLHCIWCHNPESILPAIQPDLKNPGRLFGCEMSVNEVMEVVIKDRAFYDTSGGGITLSGGEPMLQFDFAEALLMAARKQRIHTCLDTSGCAPEALYRRIRPLVDVFLYDYKATDPVQHEMWTGVRPEAILTNLRMLYDLGPEIILRCPIVPGLNATDAHFRAIASLAGEMPRLRINILPCHSMGHDKWARSGQKNPLPFIDDITPDQKKELMFSLLSYGCPSEHLVIS